MTEELRMLDDEEDEEAMNLVHGESTIAIVIQQNWQQIRNVVTLPKEDAIKLAINILVQADLQ